MGMASASASGSAGIDSHGSGNLSINPPNYGLYIVLGIVAVIVGLWFIKKK